MWNFLKSEESYLQKNLNQRPKHPISQADGCRYFESGAVPMDSNMALPILISVLAKIR
jgi:hypothetical protein